MLFVSKSTASLSVTVIRLDEDKRVVIFRNIGIFFLVVEFLSKRWVNEEDPHWLELEVLLEYSQM